MSRYFDTSLLVKLYVPEPDSKSVLAAVRSQSTALVYTPLHDLELKNAVRAKLFRHELSSTQTRHVINDVTMDVRAGLLRPSMWDWQLIQDRAEALSGKFTPVTGCRTLDILHVAGALEAKATDFYTGDQRQAKLAKLAGLTVTLI